MGIFATYLSFCVDSKLKRPLHPKTVVHASTSGSKEETAVPVSILAAFFDNGEGTSLQVVHGSFLKPKFETVVSIRDHLT